MSNLKRIMQLSAGTVLSFTFGAPVAFGDVNLEWRKSVQSVCPGEIVAVSLFAVCAGPGNQSLSAVDLAVIWDPAYLAYQGIDPSGSVELTASFLPVADPFGINESAIPTDGSMLYCAYAPLGSPVVVTPAGVQLATFQFAAIQATPAATLIEMRESLGTPQILSTVWSGDAPNTPATGTLANARIGVTLQICPGDLNDDLLVDLLDLTTMLSAFGVNTGGDLDCDGDTDLDDLTGMLSQFGVFCQ